MQTSFQNQLTRAEIRTGLLAYLFKGLWYCILIIFVAVFVFGLFAGGTIVSAGLAAIVGAVVAALLVFLVFRQQFSTGKIATYYLLEDQVEIHGSNGVVYGYAYNDIRILAAGSVIVLCLPKYSLAIVAARNLSSEQMGFLYSKQRKS